MKQVIVSMLLFISVCGYADELHYKNGCVLTNVTLIGETPDKYSVRTSDSDTVSVLKAAVNKVVSKSVAPGSVTELINCMDRKATNRNLNGKLKINYASLGLGLLSSLLAYDYFSTAADIQDAIELASGKYKSELKSQKNRKIILGIGCAVAAIVGYANAYERVQVNATTNGLSLSYSF